jgi:predicted metalloprotease with PDZ domain
MASSLSAAKRRKARSMTKSSQNIINHNAFDWIGKIIQLGNFYEKGKFIAFSMDMELFLQSNGTYRLRDLMLDLHKKYEGSYFKDDEFLDDLVEMTFPEMKPFVDNYIVGKQIPPYEFYFDKMGKKFMAEGTKKASYGRPHWGYDQKTGQYFVSKYDESNLQAKVGDTLYSVNDTLLTRERMNKVWYQLYYPEKKEEIKLTVLRNGEQVELRGKATKKTKNRYAYLLSKEERTEEQNDLYKQFIYYKQD